MTSSGVRDWLVSTSQGQGGCAMKTLSVAFGRQHTDNCGACHFCRNIPLTNLQAESTNRIQKANNNESACQRVLKHLATNCLVCGKHSCRGIPLLRGVGSTSLPENTHVCFKWKMCYSCGVSTHDQKDCLSKKDYTNNCVNCEC